MRHRTSTRLGRGRFRVKITLHTADGRKISGTRRYHTCRNRIKSHRAPRSRRPASRLGAAWLPSDT